MEQIVTGKDAFNKLNTHTHPTHTQRCECKGQEEDKRISQCVARKENHRPGISIERI